MKNMEFHSPPSADFEGKTPVETIAAVTARLFLKENQQTQQMLIKRFAQRKNYSDIAAEHGLTAERIRQICDQFSRGVKFQVKSQNDPFFESIIDFQIKNFEILEESFFTSIWCPGRFLLGLLSDIFPELPTDHNINRDTSRISGVPYGLYKTHCYYLFRHRFMVPLEEVINWMAAIPHYDEKQLVTDPELSLKLNGIRFLHYHIYISVIKENGIIFLVHSCSLSEMAEKIIRHYNRAMQWDEIVKIAKPHISRMPDNKSDVIYNLRDNINLFQVSEGVFGIADHTSYSVEDWDAIRKFAEALLERDKKIVDVALLYDEIVKIFDKISSKEELGFILRGADNIRHAGGKLFAHASVDLSNIKTLAQLVRDFLQSQGGIASRDQIFKYVSDYRSYSSEGFTSNLKNNAMFQYYDGNYYGLSYDDKKNRKLLSVTPDFICSYMLEKLHPKTGINDIITGFAGFNTKKVVETIRADERFLVTRFPGSDEEAVICKNWQRNKIILSIVRFNGGSIDHPSLCTWLVKLDQKYHDINVPNLMQLGIKFSRNIYTYQEENNTK